MATGWAAVNPTTAMQLSDARLQLHHAAQFAAAVGISYLTPRPDDSHTNLGWDPRLEALRCREVRALSHAVRVAIRPRDLTLLILLDGSIGQRIPLHGSTMSQVESSLRSALASCGLDSRRLTMRRHYDIPEHRVARGSSFDITRTADFAELAHWYGNAAALLSEFKRQLGSSDVRCWPHHFDIATLASVAPGQTCGMGMSPGDAQYGEPYFYVNAYPRPSADTQQAALAGDGFWNTERWFGAVLPASRLTKDITRQKAQVRAFMDSAIEACSEVFAAQ